EFRGSNPTQITSRAFEKEDTRAARLDASPSGIRTRVAWQTPARHAACKNRERGCVGQRTMVLESLCPSIDARSMLQLNVGRITTPSRDSKSELGCGPTGKT